MSIRRFLVLIAENDPAITRFIRRTLEDAKFRTIVASDGETAFDLFQSRHPNLIILNVAIQDPNWEQLCIRLKATSNLPVILVGDAKTESDLALGLMDKKADDFLVLPFGSEAVVARVNALLSRSYPWSQPMTGQLECGELKVNFVDSSVTLRDQNIHLTPTEDSLIRLLALHEGKVLTSSQILSLIWGESYRGEIEILRTHINRLRQKIESDPDHPTRILTKYGVGYWLNCPSL